MKHANMKGKTGGKNKASVLFNEAESQFVWPENYPVPFVFFLPDTVLIFVPLC